MRLIIDCSEPIPRPCWEVEREAIVAALRYTRGDKAYAAVLLEIGRNTLYAKIRSFEIQPHEWARPTERCKVVGSGR
jgi:DNA-binding NtrC family response regulator